MAMEFAYECLVLMTPVLVAGVFYLGGEYVAEIAWNRSGGSSGAIEVSGFARFLQGLRDSFSVRNAYLLLGFGGVILGRGIINAIL